MSTSTDKKKQAAAVKKLKKEQEKLEAEQKELARQQGMADEFENKKNSCNAAGSAIDKLKEWMTHVPYDCDDESVKLNTYFEVVECISKLSSTSDYDKICAEGNLNVTQAAILNKYICKAM